MGDTGLWTPELFMAELDNLRQTLRIQNFDLLGQSWGGMLAALYTVTVQPVGLRKFIISNSPASMRTWMTVANKLRTAMPLDIQNILARCEKEGKTDTLEYEAAINEFNKRHSCRLDTLPKELVEPFQAWVSDPTVCMTMFGASDFEISGSLKSFSIEEDLKRLKLRWYRADSSDEWLF